MTRVLLADDHPLVRQGLRAVFGTVEDIEVVGEVSDGRETVRRAVELAPDVVLMDLQMPGLHGIEATREILARRPATAVLVLTMFEDDDTVFAAVRAGALGYLVKGAEGVTSSPRSAPRRPASRCSAPPSPAGCGPGSRPRRRRTGRSLS